MSSSEQPEPAAGAVPDAPDNMADAETLLREMLHTIAREHNYQHEQLDIKAITSGGANYTSVLFLATITSPGRPDLKLFAKVACVGEKFREKFNAAILFRNEQIFYNTLIKTWDRLQEKYQIPEQHRFVGPKFYGGKSEIGSETVVMENLIAAGYSNYDRFRSVDWELASKSIEEMAKFHALSYVHAKEDPEEFKELLEMMKFDMTVDGDNAVMKDMWKLMLDRATGVLTEDGRERIIKYFDGIDIMDVYVFYRRPTHTPILAHGDFRPSNMLYKKQDGVIKPIVLDFQTLHSGSPVADLMYFIFLGTDEQFRKEHYHQLLEHYYLQLGLALARYQVDVADVYPREDFDDDLKKLIYYAIILGVSVLPVVTVEAENAPKMDDVALETFIVPSNELYSQRFNGIINDLVRWGVI